MILDILLKTIITYFFILLVMKFMGKREIGQLSLFDFVVVLIIADIAVIGIENDTVPFYYYLLAILLLALVQRGLALMLLKLPKVRNFFDGKESIIVINGKVNIKEMRKQGYNFDDLSVQLRLKNIRSLSEVDFLALESNGEISVFRKKASSEVANVKEKNVSLVGGNSTSLTVDTKQEQLNIFPFPLIVSGEIKKDALKMLSLSRKWLIEEVKKQGYDDYHQVLYATYENKKLFIIDTCEF